MRISLRLVYVHKNQDAEKKEAGAILKPSSLLLFVSLLGLLAAGCGKGTGDVSGSVTYNGKPVVVGNVMMVGDDGRPHHGKLQPDGTFTVKNVPVGTAMVSVSSPYRKLPPRPPRTNSQVANNQEDPSLTAYMPDMTHWFPIPLKYRDPFNSGLRCEVQKGENTHAVELTGSVENDRRSGPRASR